MISASQLAATRGCYISITLSTIRNSPTVWLVCWSDRLYDRVRNPRSWTGLGTGSYDALCGCLATVCISEIADAVCGMGGRNCEL